MKNQTLNMHDSSHKDLPVLVLMTFVLFAIKAVWAVQISSGPLINDELLYKFNASAIFDLQKYFTAHYPPAYSLVLAPALFFQDWYEGMLVLNAFWSSLVVPAAWLLARVAGVQHPLLAAALAALLPMQVVYPNILYSENLFVPLFVLAMALALRGGQHGHLEALAFGIVLGMTHLTKYLFLPAVPLLFGAWLYSRSRTVKDLRSGSLLQRYLPAFLVLASYCVVIGVWLLYGLNSGFNLKELFGLGISGIKSKAVTGGSFFMWAVVYSAYIILAWLPIWGVVVIWLSQLSDKFWRIRPEPQQARFLILTLMLSGCYWLVAVQHSFGVEYNYPVPKYMIGRYLMHLTPIMLVVGVWVLERIADSQSPFRPVKALINVGVLLGLVILSWWILFNQGVWAFNAGFANREPGTVDVIALVPPQMLFVAIVLVLLTQAMVRFRKNDIRIITLPMVAFMLTSLAVDAGRIHARQNGLHYRQMAYAAENRHDRENDTLNIFTDNQDLLQLLSQNHRGKDWAMKMNQKRLSFWGVNPKQILIHDISKQAGFQFASIQTPSLLVSNTLFNMKPLRKYTVNGNTYYIYRLDGLDPGAFRTMIPTSGKDGK